MESFATKYGTASAFQRDSYEISYDLARSVTNIKDFHFNHILVNIKSKIVLFFVPLTQKNTYFHVFEIFFKSIKLLILIITLDYPLVCNMLHAFIIPATIYSGLNFFTRFLFSVLHSSNLTPFSSTVGLRRNYPFVPPPYSYPFGCIRQRTCTPHSCEPMQYRTTRMHNRKTIMSLDREGGTLVERVVCRW